ncbi:MAG: class I SAM-dependent RNA methyltransferase [Spirochaetes bacterium]|nr:class I SAM-dependent RNA methyltransferase [Spirochaetota bacterium]
MNTPLTIEKIVHNGYGLARGAREHNKTYFIPYTIEGESVKIKIIEDKHNFAYAEAVEILKRSPHRIQPECPHFQICGGCDFQHIGYDHQIEIKKGILQEFLKKEEITPAEPPVFIPSPEPYHYRLNARLQVWNKRAGYFQKNSKKVIPIDACPILPEHVFNFIRSIKDMPSVPELNIKTDNNKTISANIRDNKLSYTIDDLKVEYDHRVFFQANQFLIRPWLDLIRGLAEPFNKKRVVELYCGTGIISLYLAKNLSIKKITGIDSDNTAANYAKRNREKNKLFNTNFVAGKVERVIDNYDHANIVIIDPPRKGVPEEVLAGILKLKPEAIIYTSCEISTFIRDTQYLTSKSYTLEKLTCLDMFPQTYHFETVGLFVK